MSDLMNEYMTPEKQAMFDAANAVELLDLHDPALDRLLAAIKELRRVTERNSR